MSNLDNLTQKILDDSRNEAALIIEESEKLNQELINSKIKEANDKKSRILDRAALEAAMIKDRVVSNAELSSRDEILKAKQNVIDKVFDTAKENLKDINEEDYIKFLNNKISSLKLKGSETLIVPEKMRTKVKSLGLKNPVSDIDTVKSGFLLKDGNIIMNFSFDSLVDYLRDELEGEIAKELFKG